MVVVEEEALVSLEDLVMMVVVMVTPTVAAVEVEDQVADLTVAAAVAALVKMVNPLPVAEGNVEHI
tara:strand:- start:254 stop:451 length:198 start_codon:yes stop_codon:yes gene_type:complete